MLPPLPAALTRLLKRLAITMALTSLVVSVCMLILLNLGLQSQPLQLPHDQGSKAQLAQQIQQGRLLQRTLQGEAIHLGVPLSQLNALLDDVVSRSVGGRARLVPVSAHRVDLFAAVPTQRTPLRRWLPAAWFNVHTQWVLPDGGKFRLDAVRVGQIPVPVFLVDAGFRLALAREQLSDIMAIGLECIQGIQVNPQMVVMDWQWRADLKARTFAALIPRSQIVRIEVHQRAMAKAMEEAVPVAAEHGGNMPLLTILKPMFDLAKQRSLAQQMLPAADASVEQLPILENRAALLVMTLHAMGIEPAQLIPEAVGWPGILPYPFTLRDRADFAQHYLLSALIASGVGGKVADLLGLYKEQSDKVAGSGFSFNDVAADRAGIRLGIRARTTPQELQVRIQDAEDEDFIMPRVDDMPQFLTAKEFQARFSGHNRGAYEAMLSLIDQRIDQLAVLR